MSERVLWGRSRLPSNATWLMRALSETFAEAIEALPRGETIPDVLSHERCPEVLLPWLAWEWSVDTWEPAWPVATKRYAIASSWDIHSKKGTVYALERAIDVLGYGATVSEWWQYGGGPFTFRLALTSTFERPWGAAEYGALYRTAMRAKNVRSFLEFIQVRSTGGTVPVAVGAVHRARIRFRPSVEPVTAVGGQASLFVGAVHRARIRYRPRST